MVGHEHFDELARGLATNRLSRRQILTGLGAGLLASFAEQFLPRQMREAVAAQTSPRCDSPEVADCIDDAADDLKSGIKRCHFSLLACLKGGGYGCVLSETGYLGCLDNAREDFIRKVQKVCARKGACQVGQLCCNGSCVDQDRNNCGACGRICPTGAVCKSGQFGLGKCVCPSGTSECGDTCCPTGRCCGSICCPNDQECCNGSCKDTKGDDPQNCGSCGNVCPSGKCELGVCQDPGCDQPCGQCETCEAVPDSVGGTIFACVPIPDAKPCGDACISCPEGQAPDANCECQPECQVTCNAPQVLNPDTCQCECPISCPEGQVPDANCECHECPSGLTYCGGECVDTLSDPNNCGSCGHVCPGNKICGSNGTWGGPGYCTCPDGRQVPCSEDSPLCCETYTHDDFGNTSGKSCCRADGSGFCCPQGQACAGMGTANPVCCTVGADHFCWTPDGTGGMCCPKCEGVYNRCNTPTGLGCLPCP